MTDFDVAFGRLNDAQRSAVETIEGPVMCVAGPGTGKTQVVALRVANILRRTQMRPSNILCLTFSSSGATAMRERLRSLIGADAYGVTVSTIHGFCNDIIVQHPHVFDTWAALEQLSDIEQYRAVNKIIDSLLPDLAIVNKKSPHARTRDIIGRISQVKREGKTMEHLHAVAREYRKEMEEKSRPGTKAYEKNLLAARKFEEFIRIFAAYQDMLVETQRYDYDDMILHVIAALEEEDWMLASLQERYQYILVDEFQDTNGAQYRFIELLTTYVPADQEPNFFVVGDDDQAIYRFQGANLQNIMKFRNRFPTAPVIVLSMSYRSTQAILDAAGKLISHNEERLVNTIPGLRKDLKAASGEQGKDPALVFAPSDVIEPWMVADMVEERLAAGVPLDEIAILTQTNAELFAYYDVLRARHIPVQIQAKADLLGHPLVRQTLSILKAVIDPEISSDLHGAISAECFGCHTADIGRINHQRIEAKQSLLSLLLDLDKEGSEVASMQMHNRSALIEARNCTLSLHQNLENRTIVGTLEHLLKETGILPDPERDTIDPMDFAALQAFFDRVRYRAYEEAAFDVRSLMHDLKFYENPDYGNIRMTYAIPHLVDEGVQLMTAHQSKGLEFDVVFLVNFREAQWDQRRNPSSLSIPEELLFGWEKDTKSFEQHQDERRVAFVAMTRARTELIFTCPRELTIGNKMKSTSPSGFFAQAGTLPETDGTAKNLERVSTLLYTPIRHIDDELAAFLRKRLETYALSVTALNHFLEDPQEFLALDLLQMPQVKESSLVYGNAVHAALKAWGMSMQEGLPSGLKRFMDTFRNYLVERELTTEIERKTLLSLGEESLPRYFQERLATSTPVVHKVEYSIRTHLEDIPLKGSLDRIDLAHPDSATATIIDYKTGHPKTESQIREGGYYRQLVFYAILLELARPDLKPVAYILDFIGEGPEHPVTRTFQISEQEKADLKAVIRAVWKKIQALDFTPLQL